MIQWKRIKPFDEIALPAAEAHCGTFLLTIEQTDDYRVWAWSLGIVGGDGAEITQGTAPSEYYAKCSARRALVNILAKAERHLAAPYRRHA